LILRKIVDTVATRCHILKLKRTKFDFGWGSVPAPTESLPLPQTPYLDFRGLTSKGREGRKDGREGQRGKGEGRIGKGRGEGREGRGRKWRTIPALFHPLRALDTALCGEAS